MNTKMLKAAVAGLVLSVSGFANAGLIENGAELSNPDVFLDFSEVLLPASTTLTDQYSAFGILFSGFTYLPCLNCVEIPLRPDIGNFSDNNTGSWITVLSMLFPNNITDITFQFAFNAGASITALLNGNVVETINFTNTNFTVYGFTGILFDEVRFGATQAFLVDNVSFNDSAVDVPAPASLALFGLGILGLVASRKRKANRN